MFYFTFKFKDSSWSPLNALIVLLMEVAALWEELPLRGCITICLAKS